MSSRPLSMPSGFSWAAIAVLAAVVGFVAWDAGIRGRHVLELTPRYGVTVDAPAPSAASPTGYADGRRSLMLPTGAADTAHWIMQTQEMIATGAWRIRRVDYDNPPHGREVHWAAPLHWWLAGLAWCDHAISGRPIGQSVEYAVLYSGPVMFALMLLGVGGILWRKFSPAAATLFGLAAIATYPFYLDFVSGYADHHGVANLCGLLTVLGLAAGAGEATAAGARRWFVVSALAGGSGLWISAATQVPVLLGLGLGVLVAGAVARGATPRPRWMNEPGLFALWGRVGGAVSLATWLFEYFPGHLGLRLEINHPLYAAAWVGAGELLRVAVTALRDGPRSLASADRMRGAIGAGLVLLLPLVMALTSGRAFLVADPFLWRLHAEYIAEFQGLTRLLRRGLTWGSAALWLPMFVLLPAAVGVFRRADPVVRATLALVLVPALLGWLMGWNQIRWLSLALALSVPVMAVFFRDAVSTPASTLRWLAAGCLLFAPGLATTVQKTLRGADFTTEDIRTVVERDVAHWLRLHGSGRVVVAAPPAAATKFIYFGGVTGVGTLYWENIDGLKNIADLFATPSPAEAGDIARKLGVTHIVFISWGAFENTLVRLRRGLPEDAPLPADALLQMLARQPVAPPWLRAVPFKLPQHPALEGEHVRIWEVVPEQAPATALAQAANFYLELGLLDPAAKLAPALMHFENDLSALVMLAAIASRDRDAEGFSVVFGRVLARLPQAGNLAPDELIRLATVLTVGRRPDLAQGQLRVAVQKLDEAGLRRLSLGTLTDLLTLADGLKVSLPADLQRLAMELIPPDRRD